MRVCEDDMTQKRESRELELADERRETGGKKHVRGELCLSVGCSSSQEKTAEGRSVPPFVDKLCVYVFASCLVSLKGIN